MRYRAIGRALLAGLLALALASAAFAGTVPQVAYETTIGGHFLASGRAMTVDAAGNAYIASRWIGDGNDILLSRLDPDGSVVWSFEIQGNAIDYATGIAIAPNGNVWVTGWTDSDDFPLVDPLDAIHDVREAFLMALDPADGTILYSTYFGGDYADTAEDITFDAQGNIWLVGSTESSDFPTVNPIQGELNSPPYQFSDFFITQFAPNGRTVLYSTYFGGSNNEFAHGIRIADDGGIWITGDTQSTDFLRKNPLQGVYAGGERDLVVVKIHAGGASVDFSSYLGGEDIDRVAGLDLGPDGSVYLGGTTRSVGFPTTPGAFQEVFAGEIGGCEVPFGAHYNCEDVFVTRIAPDGSSLLYSSYLGGIRPEECRDITVDFTGAATVSGYTNSPDFPGSSHTTAAAMFVSQLEPDGDALRFTHTVDSGSANAGGAVAVDAGTGVYFSGAINVPADVYVSKLVNPVDSTTGVGPLAGAAIGVPLLRASVPNPFRGETRIAWDLPRAAQATVHIYDARGALVRTLADGTAPAGTHTARWSGTDNQGQPVTAGVYFARLVADGRVETQKVTYLR